MLQQYSLSSGMPDKRSTESEKKINVFRPKIIWQKGQISTDKQQNRDQCTIAFTLGKDWDHMKAVLEKRTVEESAH